jgi:hypothetical protein
VRDDWFAGQGVNAFWFARGFFGPTFGWFAGERVFGTWLIVVFALFLFFGSHGGRFAPGSFTFWAGWSFLGFIFLEFAPEIGNGILFFASRFFPFHFMGINVGYVVVGCFIFSLGGREFEQNALSGLICRLSWRLL